MRAFRLVVALLLITAIMAGGAFAVGEEELYGFSGAEELEKALPEEAGELLEDFGVADAMNGENRLDAVLDRLGNIFPGLLRRTLGTVVKVMAVILLVALAAAVLPEGAAKDAAVLCGCIAVSAISLHDVGSYFKMAVDTIQSLSDFSRVLLPTMCTAAVSAGAVTSAAVKYAASALFMDVFISVGKTVIIPVTGAFLACAVATAVFGRDALDGITSGIKWVGTKLLILLVTAFTLYLGISGLVSTAADGAAVKAASSAMGALLPVVGSVLADAAGTVVSAAGVLRNAVGVFGFLAVAAICIVPFVRLGVFYIAYKAAGAFAAAVSDKRMGGLLDAIGSAYGILLGLVGACGVMLFISIISTMRVVTGA